MTDDDPPLRSLTIAAFLDALRVALLEHERREPASTFRELLLRRIDWTLNRPRRPDSH